MPVADEIELRAQRTGRVTLRGRTGGGPAAPMAVKISEALSASAVFIRPIDVTEREYGALRHARSNEQTAQF
jgi:hypothetical protein